MYLEVFFAALNCLRYKLTNISFDVLLVHVVRSLFIKLLYYNDNQI